MARRWLGGSSAGKCLCVFFLPTSWFALFGHSLLGRSGCSGARGLVRLCFLVPVVVSGGWGFVRRAVQRTIEQAVKRTVKRTVKWTVKRTVKWTDKCPLSPLVER